MFQGKSARSKHWFDHDIERFEENLSTRGSHFYKSLFQINIQGQSGLKYPIFPVTIVNTKETGEIEYDIQYPLVSYHQNASNFFFIS